MHRRIQINSQNENQILYISQTIINDSFTATLHSHPNLEILLIIDGEGEIKTTNKTIPIKKNDLVIINQFTKHYELSLSYCSFYAIGVNNLKLSSTKNLDAINKHSLNLLTSKYISELYHLIFIEATNKKTNYINIIDNSFNIIKELILRETETIIDSNENTNINFLVSSVEKIIKNYYNTSIRLDLLSSNLAISTSKLCHDFKKETGISIIEYKLKCQIDEAINLLIITDMNIVEISTAVGFNSSSYFSKTFKKITGLTPKEYREKSKKTNQK